MATYTNKDSTSLASGTLVTYPIIAVGSFCVVTLEGSSLLAGEVRNITIGTNTIKVVLDSNGKGEFSLLPFMRVDALANNIQRRPCASNQWRGQLTMTISEPDSSDVEKTIDVFYILGDCPPQKAMTTDVWRTYNVDSLDFNMVAVDWATHYTSGVPNSLVLFKANWDNASGWVSPPTTDKVVTFNVIQVCADKIYEGSLNYHFTADSRTEDVVQVRWIDADGNISSRKFTKGGESYGGGVSSSYKRPHSTKVLVLNSYDYGDDEWQNFTPQRTLTIGDDAITAGQWDWLCSLATSRSVEIYEDGIWKRCSISSNSMERDPRKAVFSFSLTLVLPTADNVEV